MRHRTGRHARAGTALHRDRRVPGQPHPPGDTALNTLRYVDCALLARRITADCLLSVGLMDPTCPPSTVFAAYNAIGSKKEIAVSRFGTHVVPVEHTERQLAHLREHLGCSR
ncbi:MAG: acetylxylan esterase [Trebonia sp.]